MPSPPPPPGHPPARPPSSSSTPPWLRDATAGAAAGAANLVTGFPFDTVKVTMQQARAAPYPSAAAAARAILAAGGLAALFRGMAVPLAGAAGETAINYAAYTAGLRSLARWGEGGGREGGSGEAPPARPPLPAVALAAAGAGAALSPVLAPAELIKVRLQADAVVGGARRYSGPLACVRATLAADGLAGFGRGLAATAAREVPGNAIFFVTYEALRRTLLPPAAPPSSSSLLADAGTAIAAGAVAGAVMWGAVLPIDCVKTAVQASPPGSPRSRLLPTARRLVAAGGGPGALYAGLGPVLARAAPANAAQWLAWELAVRGWGAGGGV